MLLNHVSFDALELSVRLTRACDRLRPERVFPPRTTVFRVVPTDQETLGHARSFARTLATRDSSDLRSFEGKARKLQLQLQQRERISRIEPKRHGYCTATAKAL